MVALTKSYLFSTSIGGFDLDLDWLNT